MTHHDLQSLSTHPTHNQKQQGPNTPDGLLQSAPLQIQEPFSTVQVVILGIASPPK